MGGGGDDEVKNEPGRQKLGRSSCPASTQSMQSYILTYSSLRKREPLVALCFVPKGHKATGTGRKSLLCRSLMRGYPLCSHGLNDLYRAYVIIPVRAYTHGGGS